MKKVVGCVRVSSAEQAKEGLSLAMQGRKITAYCENNELELVCIYFDGGISAKDIKHRPAFKAALDLVYSGQVDGIVVYKLDRAFRNTKEALATVEKLGKLGHDFVSVSEKIDTTTAMGKLFFTMMAAFAQFERDVTSERTTVVMQDKQDRQEKTGGHVPFGFQVEEKAQPGKDRLLKVLIPEPTEQKIIARIHELKAAGHGYRSIASELNREGYKTRTGVAWSHKTVIKIMGRVAA
ncbi:MAG: recombinase family protein [Desulfomonilaceae bacterium]